MLCVRTTFGTWTGTNSNHYLEMSFSGTGSVAGGSDSGEIQARFNDSGYASWSQTNDYSFDSTKTSYGSWTHMTLYENGTLVWGTEP